MERRVSSLTQINLIKNGKLDCSSSNHYFHFLLGYLLLLSKGSIYIFHLDPFESKFFFQSAFQNLIVDKNGSIDTVDYGEVFHGAFADEFQRIYINMLELWKDIQSDMIPHEAVRIKLNDEEVRERLTLIFNSLNGLIRSLD